MKAQEIRALMHQSVKLKSVVFAFYDRLKQFARDARATERNLSPGHVVMDLFSAIILPKEENISLALAVHDQSIYVASNRSNYQSEEINVSISGVETLMKTESGSHERKIEMSVKLECQGKLIKNEMVKLCVTKSATEAFRTDFTINIPKERMKEVLDIELPFETTIEYAFDFLTLDGKDELISKIPPYGYSTHLHPVDKRVNSLFAYLGGRLCQTRKYGHVPKKLKMILPIVVASYRNMLIIDEIRVADRNVHMLLLEKVAAIYEDSYSFMRDGESPFDHTSRVMAVFATSLVKAIQTDEDFMRMSTRVEKIILNKYFLLTLLDNLLPTLSEDLQEALTYILLRKLSSGGLIKASAGHLHIVDKLDEDSTHALMKLFRHFQVRQLSKPKYISSLADCCLLCRCFLNANQWSYVNSARNVADACHGPMFATWKWGSDLRHHRYLKPFLTEKVFFLIDRKDWLKSIKYKQKTQTLLNWLCDIIQDIARIWEYNKKTCKWEVAKKSIELGFEAEPFFAWAEGHEKVPSLVDYQKLNTRYEEIKELVENEAVHEAAAAGGL